MIRTLIPVRWLIGPMVAFTALLAVGCSAEQVSVFTMVNAERAAAGAAELLPSPHATTKAQAWAEEMAGSQWLRHSNVSDGMPDGFTRLGENVGRGPGVEEIHRAFLASAAHRTNMLDPTYRWMGVGVARSPSGVVYVATVFAAY